MKTDQCKANFRCLRHKAHRSCYTKYENSENGKKSEYLCPLRCSKAGF